MGINRKSAGISAALATLFFSLLGGQHELRREAQLPVRPQHRQRRDVPVHLQRFKISIGMTAESNCEKCFPVWVLGFCV